MITWMQKNKKYLVPTIWISTIAFVGAGFVGWGAYDMNTNRATSVAKVGDRAVSIQEVNEKYSQLYNQYNNIFDGKLTEEKAGELGLEGMALQAAIQESMLLNFANELGLSASDEDVVRYIAKSPEFQTDGVFNKNLYYDTLRRARINPNDFEKGIKRAVLLEKLNTALSLNASAKDVEIMSSAFSMQDTIAFSIISTDESEIKVDEAELKKLWESNKDKYLTKKSYDLETLTIGISNDEADEALVKAFYEENKANYRDAEDKILPFEEAKERANKDYLIEQSRRSALEKYVAVKKGELATDGSLSFTEDDAKLPLEEFNNAKSGDVLKPILTHNGYIIAKVKSVNLPKPMEFDAAREQVLKLYMQDKFSALMSEKAKSELAKFDPKNAEKTTIAKDKESKVGDLDMFEVGNFVSHVFDSANKKGYVVLGEKAVIYEILEQKLLTNSDESHNVLAMQNMQAMKNNEMLQDLIKELQKRYKVEEYIKR
ncbi:peptidylprolyl isomerase [Campylobacter sp. 9BO]|uniref:peptidylprolyl isomerase n=1 Tax=Campylobacter sp. 9BO TaxID=3424759 RepID=UPI003D34882B